MCERDCGVTCQDHQRSQPFPYSPPSLPLIPLTPQPPLTPSPHPPPSPPNHPPPPPPPPVHELRQWAPDVILIQDVEASAFAALERPLRGLGFQGIRVGSSGPGQAVFYKVSMFDLVHVRGCVANAILGRSPAQVGGGWGGVGWGAIDGV